jgi:PIN domain nuclease of toxin-antitoxin system
LSGYLLDTHALLWLQLDSPTPRDGVRQTLVVAPLFVSVASIAEIAIKAGVGKLPLPAPSHTDFAAAVRAMQS